MYEHIGITGRRSSGAGDQHLLIINRKLITGGFIHNNFVFFAREGNNLLKLIYWNITSGIGIQNIPVDILNIECASVRNIYGGEQVGQKISIDDNQKKTCIPSCGKQRFGISKTGFLVPLDRKLGEKISSFPPLITSRNLQPRVYKAFRPLSQKNHPLFCKKRNLSKVS